MYCREEFEQIQRSGYHDKNRCARLHETKPPGKNVAQTVFRNLAKKMIVGKPPFKHTVKNNGSAIGDVRMRFGGLPAPI